MKKFVLLFLCLILGWNLSAQKGESSTVPLKPLYELFTSSTCPPCAYANPIIDAVLDDNPNTHSLIKYQMSWPGVGDPYYTAEGGVRRTYYGVNGVPDLFINSNHLAPADLTQDIYDSYQTATTSLEIEVVNANIDIDNVIDIEVNLNPLDDYAAGLTAHMVVVEKITVENVGNNGEVEFNNVMLKMFPDASGTTLPALTNGVSETLIASYDMDNTFMEGANDLALIIFVQDDSDKSLIQSEQVDVESTLDDFTVTINVLDINNNPIQGGNIYMEGYGEEISDNNGIVTYENVLAGIYEYTGVASGYLDAEGEIEVIDSDVEMDVVFEDPGYYYYEDFTDGIPDFYTAIVTSPDYLYGAAGMAIFFRQSDENNPIILVTDLIDITPGEKIFFDIGDDSGYPMELLFGTVTDPSDPESFVAIESIVPTSDWITYEYVLEDICNGQTEVYFAWKHNTIDNTFCGLDNVKINYGEVAQTYFVNFNVIDGGEPVEGASVTINGNTQVTNANGVATFPETPNGNYDYLITAYGYYEYEDQVEVDGQDVDLEVNLLIDGLFNQDIQYINVYPNPVNDLLKIESSELIQSIEIFELTGKLVDVKEVNSDAVSLFMKRYGNGVYYLKINTLNSIENVKLIVK